jgi:2,3-bisphosphoglycerate-dependent phosphoglycerate mutase
VFSSDLRRAVETVSIAFDGSGIPVLYDWRQAVARVGRFPGDLQPRWDGKRLLVVGHVATRRGLDHFIGGATLEDLAEADFAWQPGWEYRRG